MHSIASTNREKSHQVHQDYDNEDACVPDVVELENDVKGLLGVELGVALEEIVLDGLEEEVAELDDGILFVAENNEALGVGVHDGTKLLDDRILVVVADSDSDSNSDALGVDAPETDELPDDGILLVAVVRDSDVLGVGVLETTELLDDRSLLDEESDTVRVGVLEATKLLDDRISLTDDDGSVLRVGAAEVIELLNSRILLVVDDGDAI
ncbi:hypothetical protein GQ44DRAFT_769610 [Phaeosphaeriaceae sp. PMI808]|nr:hypothetical protein GQ44DRAFT_769610 [Phaeosphaeriaceae sp. PMI808]